MEPVWVSLFALYSDDLGRYQKQYTIDRSDIPYPDDPMDFFQVTPESMSPRRAYATVKSPECFGPEHLIKVHVNDVYSCPGAGFFWTFEDAVKTLLMSCLHKAWSLYFTCGTLFGFRDFDSNSRWGFDWSNVYRDYRELAEVMPKIQEYIRILHNADKLKGKEHG